MGSSPDSAPIWARAADVLAIALAAVACWIALSGGGRYIVFGIVLPLASAAPVLFLAAGVLLVRHVAVPRPSIVTRARLARARIAQSPALDSAITLTASTRVAVLAAGLLAVVTIGFSKPPSLMLSSDPLTNLPARFDAGWYGDIALDGYDRDRNLGSQRNIAFFPAMPLLMRPLGALFGAYASGVPRSRAMTRMLWAGVLISFVAFAVAVYYLVRLGADLVGIDAAARAALLFSTYPFAIFFSAPYTESIYLASAVGAIFHLRRAELVAAATWGALAGLSRPNGFLVTVPLAMLVVGRAGEASVPQGGQASFPGVREKMPVPLFTGLLVAAVPTLAMLAFTLYLREVTGVWFAWARSHEAWGRNLSGPAAIMSGYALLRDEGVGRVLMLKPFDAMNTIAGLFALAMLWPVFRRLGAALAVFVAINLAPAVLSGGALSLGRVTSTLFPVFLALAIYLSSRGTAAWAAAFAILQGLAAALFFTWRELF